MAARSRHMVIGICLVVMTMLGISTGIVALAWERLDGIVRPWQRGLTPVADDTDRQSALATREQMMRLAADNTLLRNRLAEYATIRGEGHADPQSVVLARARIIARTVRSGRRYIELDAGALDGINKGMPVCAGWSLVGVVAGLQDGRCLVQQITDSASRIPAVIMAGNDRAVAGVLTGTGQRAHLEMNLVEADAEVRIAQGMTVVTLATEGGVPAGLVLGTVSEAQPSPSADHWRIVVTPLRTADAAESLLIIGHQPLSTGGP